MPAEKSMANHPMVENSGSASGPPKRMSPNRLASNINTKASTMFIVAMKNHPA